MSDAPQITVLGADGFIGSHLVEELARTDMAHRAVGRDDAIPLDEDLGSVIDCIGLSSDAAARPFDTVRAQIDVVADVLEHGRFTSFLALSSTRLYEDAGHGEEDRPIPVLTRDPATFFDAVCLATESLCVASGRPNVRVARLSNVYGFDPGSGNFLSSLIEDALDRGVIELRSATDSVRDYVAIQDVVRLLPQIAQRGTQPIYNLARGEQVTNAAIVEALATLTGCTWSVAPDAPARPFPSISVDALREGLGDVPARNLLDDLPDLVDRFRRER